MVFKKFMDKLSITSNAIKDVIKENSQYLEAELNVVKEAQEGILALKSYAGNETPSLETAINSLADTFESIENARKDKVTELKEKFIGPLEGLLEGFNARQDEIKEAENARKAVEKARNKAEKERAKKLRGKLDKFDDAKAAVKAAEENLKKEEEDVKMATEAFNKKKLETMQTILKNMVDVEKAFHEKVLELFGTVKEKAEAIKVEEEAVLNLAIPEEE